MRLYVISFPSFIVYMCYSDNNSLCELNIFFFLREV